MALPDATAGAQLASGAFVPAWLLFLDIATDPDRVTTAPAALAMSGTGDSDLDGFTFSAVDPAIVSISEVRNQEGGSGSLTITLSGLVGPDSDRMNLLGDQTKWRGRLARLWAIIYDPSGAQQGAVWAVYTGRMSAVRITGSPDEQVVELEVENYLASFKEASHRTYLDQATFDPGDTTADLKVGAANGATKGVSSVKFTNRPYTSGDSPYLS